MRCLPVAFQPALRVRPACVLHNAAVIQTALSPWSLQLVMCDCCITFLPQLKLTAQQALLLLQL
jgi:hypothetical protein